MPNGGVGCNLYVYGVALRMEDHLAMGDSLKIGKAAATGKATGIVAAVADAPVPESNSLVLVPPAPVAIVEEPQATNSIKLDASTLAKLDRLVADYVVAISQLDIKDPKFEARIADIRKLGDDDIKASAQVSSRLLDRPVGSMQKGGIAVAGTVSTSLLQLRNQIDDLNPGRQGDLFATRKLMGRVLPFGDRLRGYFAKYQSSQGHINAIVAGLERGQSELAKDNTDLEKEKENLWQTMERLRQYIYLAQKLDNSLTERIAKVEAKDPERAKILREDMQFYVRQKIQDLTAQLAVSVQGYLSIDVIRRNNLELVRGVDRATTTTVSALRTAVIVAQALGDQKLVLDQITALNNTTSNLIESTSVMLREQSTAINEQAATSAVDLEKLQAAFDNIYATMDEIDSFKLKALDTMSKTVEALTTQVNKAQSYLDRAKDADGAAAAGKAAAK
jgi:uncharacterized protein YaaN involved in tellurite resistance